MTARDVLPELDAAHAESAAELARRADELARLEALTQGWEPAQQAVLQALKTGIEELNAEAFKRLIRALRNDEAAGAALRSAVRDPLVYQVLRFHGLVKEPLEHRVAQALDAGTHVVHFVSPFARQQDAGWVDVCALADLLVGTAVCRQVEGHGVLLYRHEEGISCVDNACAHMGLPLDGGRVEAGTLRCPHHGFVYQLDTGECLTVPEVQLAVHAVKVVGERVAVRLRR